ncbi:probable glutamate receptor [Chironomus tepperi]|uniref:probable glutamate receptor n=1 Tax=Chironomus tepperi TaxID=113505 RepID=UPI00391F5D76
MGIFHTKNLSAPAAEIEVQYLADLHQRISVSHDHKDNGMNFQLKILSAQYSPNNYPGIMDVTLTDFYLIVTDNKDTFSNTIRTISHTKSFNEEARYVILFNNPDQRNEGRQIACEFLNMLFSVYRAVNVVVLYANDAFSYEIYIGDPYGVNGKICGDNNSGRETPACGKMKTVLAGICNRGILENKQNLINWLDMEKIPEEMGKDCIFNLCARVQEPFINEGCKDGMEIMILGFLQDEMGFDINITCTTMDRGERQEDGSWTFLLNEVREDRCDIIAGAFFPDYDTHEDFAATDYYLQDYYRFFVPKAPIEPRWKGLINIYSSDIWYAVLTTFIISWILWFIFGIFSLESYQHRQFILISLNVLCIFLGISANNRPEYNSLRFFFSILALYALIITTLYTSKLIDVFTNPKDDYQIDSIVELLESSLPIGGRLETMDWFDNGDGLDMEIYARFNSSQAFRPSPKTIHEISQGKMALLISEHYVKQTIHSNDVFGMSEELFSNHLEMLAERGFPLIKRINKILGLFRDIGIMSKLFQDFLFDSNIFAPLKLTKRIEYLRNKGQDTDDLEDFMEDQDHEHEADPEIVLTPEHLQGPFTLKLKHMQHCIEYDNDNLS